MGYRPLEQWIAQQWPDDARRLQRERRTRLFVLALWHWHFGDRIASERYLYEAYKG